MDASKNGVCDMNNFVVRKTGVQRLVSCLIRHFEGKFLLVWVDCRRNILKIITWDFSQGKQSKRSQHSL